MEIIAYRANDRPTLEQVIGVSYDLDDATVDRLELQLKTCVSNKGNTKQVIVSDHELINLPNKTIRYHRDPIISPQPQPLQLLDL